MASFPDSEHEESALRAVDCALSDELVEALRVELPPHLADPSLPRLTLLQLLKSLQSTLFRRISEYFLRLHHSMHSCGPGQGGKALYLTEEILQIFFLGVCGLNSSGIDPLGLNPPGLELDTCRAFLCPKRRPS